MQTRRLLLVIGILLLVSIAAASLVPPPPNTGQDPGGSVQETEAADPPPTASSNDEDAERIRFSVPPAREDGSPRDDGRAPSATAVGRGERVVVAVAAPKPGVVELRGLGLVQSATPGAPAMFDLFTDTSGRFDVTYAPTMGKPRVVGTLVVEDAGGPSRSRATDGSGAVGPDLVVGLERRPASPG